jgi:Papain family cysteine protease
VKRRGLSRRVVGGSLAVAALSGVAAVLVPACQPHRPATPIPAAPAAPVASTPPSSATDAGTGRSLHPPAVQNPPVPRDLQALLAAPRRKHCPPHEVAPGVWVRFHCGAFDVVANARQANPAKLRMLRHGRLRLDSPVGSAQVAGDGGLTEEDWRRLLPRWVDHRLTGTEGPVMNQAQVGCCSAFSLAAALDNAIRRQNAGDALSPMHIWSHYFTPGMSPASTQNQGRPLAVLSLWPYDEVAACKISQEDDACDRYYHVQKELPPWEADIQAKRDAADAHGTWRLTSVSCVAGSLCNPAAPVATSDPAIVAAYLATGADLWAALWIDEQAWYHPANGSIPDYTVPAEAIASGTGEGHGVALSGYDWTSGSLRFLVHNSWGDTWGDQGYAWISEAMVARYLQQAYKVTVENLVTPPAPPGDPNALTDDDCPEDELVDSVTGACASFCPGETRPAHGKCPGTGDAGTKTSP